MFDVINKWKHWFDFLLILLMMCGALVVVYLALSFDYEKADREIMERQYKEYQECCETKEKEFCATFIWEK